jgi:epoxide hydrolase-like predicted phosphatase
VIDAVISDCVGVLTTAMARPFAIFNERWDLSPGALGEALGALAERRGSNPLFDLETGRLGEAECMALIEDELETQLGRRIEMSGFADHYWEHLAANDELVAFLTALRARFRMAMLTNNVREWEPRWRAMLPVDELFEVVVDSSAVGMRKPDREIFELTVARLGVPAERCLFIDDLVHNCEAAAGLGMSVVHFRDNVQAIAEIDALTAR